MSIAESLLPEPPEQVGVSLLIEHNRHRPLQRQHSIEGR